MSKIKIEKTTQTGYEEKEYEIKEAVRLLNAEIDSNKTIFIDGAPFCGASITEQDLVKCKSEVSVTNQLVGG